MLFAPCVAAVLIGDRMFLLGDLVNWATGQAGPIVTNVMGARVPRVVAALLAGVALAVAGTAIQGVTRNPLADPTIIGVSGGASVGAVVVVTLCPAGVVLGPRWRVGRGCARGGDDRVRACQRAVASRPTDSC